MTVTFSVPIAKLVKGFLTTAALAAMVVLLFALFTGRVSGAPSNQDNQAVLDAVAKLEAQLVSLQSTVDTVREAQIPKHMTYRDRLLDAFGNPITQPQNVTFEIYPDGDGEGNPLWTSEVKVTPDQMGYYEVVLGGEETKEEDGALKAEIFDSAVRGLRIKVNDDVDSTRVIYPNLPSHGLEFNIETLMKRQDPDVELTVSVCGDLHGGLDVGGALDFLAGFHGEGEGGAKVYGNGGTMVGKANMEVHVAELGLAGGVGVAGDACVEAAFPVPVPEEAPAGPGLRQPATSSLDIVAKPGFDTTEFAEMLTSAAQFTGATPDNVGTAMDVLTGFQMEPDPVKLLATAQKAASALPLPGNLADIIADPASAIPSAADIVPKCGSDFGPLTSLFAGLCDLATNNPGLDAIKTIDDINGVVVEVKAKVETLQPPPADDGEPSKLDDPEGFDKLTEAIETLDQEIDDLRHDVIHEIQGIEIPISAHIEDVMNEITTIEGELLGKVKEVHDIVNSISSVVGTELPVDNVHGNGAQPLTYWALAAWNNIVDARENELKGIQGTVSSISTVVGTEMPVDDNYGNGAQPLTYWALAAWNHIVDARENELKTISEQASAANKRLASDIQPKLESLRLVVDNINEQASAANKRLADDVQPKLEGVRQVVSDIKGDFPAGQSYSFHTWGNLENRAREIQSSIGLVKKVVDNISSVLGTVQPTDDRYGNGQRPVTFWAFHAWNNVVAVKDKLDGGGLGDPGGDGGIGGSGCPPDCPNPFGGL